MQRRKPAHRDADDMRLVDPERVEHGADVVAGAVLRVARRLFGHVRGRVAAGVVGDAAVAPPEIAHLPFIAAVIVGEFMDKDDRRPRPGLLVIKPHTIIGRKLWHRSLPCLPRQPILQGEDASPASGGVDHNLARSLKLKEQVRALATHIKADPGRDRRITSGPHSRTSFSTCPADAHLPMRRARGGQTRPREHRESHVAPKASRPFLRRPPIRRGSSRAPLS